MPLPNWLRWIADRRRVARFRPDDLVCFYWTGAIPEPRPVRDIGLYGACISSLDAFYLGTDVQIIFEDRAAEPDGAGAKPHFCLWSRVLRRSSDAFAVSFLFTDVSERRRFRLCRRSMHRRATLPEQDRAEDGSAASMVQM
jgi:hypothetical protein